MVADRKHRFDNYWRQFIPHYILHTDRTPSIHLLYTLCHYSLTTRRQQLQRNTANSSCIQTENKLERVTVCLTATYKSSLVFFCLRRYFYFFNLPSPLVLVCNTMSQELFLVYYRCLGKSRQWCNRTSHWIALQRKTKKCTPLYLTD